jgi:hypothetical protein
MFLGIKVDFRNIFLYTERLNFIKFSISYAINYIILWYLKMIFIIYFNNLQLHREWITRRKNALTYIFIFNQLTNL